MPNNAAQIVALANEAAHSQGKVAQAQQLLNQILGDLCEKYDFADARGIFTFMFNPGLDSAFGSGPYPLPLDYLRTSGSSGSTGAQKSSFWLLQGVPYPMLPIDLSEFDMQVQQAGLQSYPYLWATDISTESTAADRIVNSTTGATHGTTTLDNLGSTANVQIGMGVAGLGIVPGSLVTVINSSSSVELTVAASGSFPSGPVTFGVPAVGYAWPPPSGSYPVTIRYQRQMPDIVDFTRVPWFRDQEYLFTRLLGEMCKLNDDPRWTQMLGDGAHGAQGILRKYLIMKDDDTNRAKQVQLDRRTFGQKFNLLPNTKQVGW